MLQSWYLTLRALDCQTICQSLLSRGREIVKEIRRQGEIEHVIWGSETRKIIMRGRRLRNDKTPSQNQKK